MLSCADIAREIERSLDVLSTRSQTGLNGIRA